MKSKVLLLNSEGQPVDWINQEDAILYHVLEKILYQIGPEDQFTFRGGVNRLTDQQSTVSTAPIIAVHGTTMDRTYKVPPISNQILFQRDNFTCAYCGRRFSASQLTRDHVIPRSRGGPDKWNNIVASCKYHNNMKDNLTLAEFGRPLQFAPYTPTFAEFLFLRQPVASLPIQTQYLLEFFPQESRIKQRALEWI